MSKEYAVYNWLTGRITPAGDTSSGAERVKVYLMEVDLYAGLNGDNLEVVERGEAERLRRAHIAGRREASRQGVGWIS